jgi:tetratricopeptide (TPR) repeat protein
VATFGKIESAIAFIKQAIGTDPLCDYCYYWLSCWFSTLDRIDEAEQAVRRAIELQPAAAGLHWQLAVIKILRRDARGALEAARQEQPGYLRDNAMAVALQIGPDRVAADSALALLMSGQRAYKSAFTIAEVYALRNEPDMTFRWLDRALQFRDDGIAGLLYDPFILRFKNDPRFAAFCRKVGLPVPGAMPTAS